MTTSPCPECAGWSRQSARRNYDHVHRVDSLPRAKHTDSHVIRRGYAVGIGGALPQLWVFFTDLEPALVFGRAGRMSLDVSGYGVYEAAHELRADERLGRDVQTLYVLRGQSLDRRPDEADAFARWVAGCDPASSHWSPPGRRRARQSADER